MKHTKPVHRTRRPLLWCSKCGSQSVFVTNVCFKCQEYKQGYRSMRTCKKCFNTTYSMSSVEEVRKNG